MAFYIISEKQEKRSGKRILNSAISDLAVVHSNPKKALTV